MPVIKKVKEHHPEGPVDAAQVHFSFISKQVVRNFFHTCVIVAYRPI
jgi:hypothetical protein